MYDEVKKDHIKERIARVRTKSLPWMNSDIRKKMNAQYKALKTAKTSQLQKDWDQYKKLRNEVKKMLRTAEREYWLANLKEAKRKDMQSFWDVVKKLKGHGKKRV